MSEPDRNLYRIAIVSDIHAHGKSMDLTSGNDIPSWVSQAVAASTRHRNPLTDLNNYIKAKGITADLLLCPGDIADKAEDAAMMYAWGELQTVAASLKAADVIASVGNHDLHSRAGAPVVGSASTPPIPSPVSPNARIRDLNPLFPLKNVDEHRRYWSDQLATYSDSHCRVVTLNSCATHGLIHEGSPEYEQGRFTEEAEFKLIELLSESDPRAINILLTHHHPQQITELQFSDKSTMIGGDRLLRLLGSGQFGSWFVIHGHRHVPYFQLGPGDNDRPFIFSAGSIGVILHPLFYPTKPPNQFYILEFDLTEIARRGIGLFGFLNAWNWNLGRGWQPAADNDPIPARSGFGNRTPVAALATQVASLIREKAKGAVGPFGILEEDVTGVCPDIAFLLPSERERFKERLEQEGISVGRQPQNKSRLLFVYAQGSLSREAS